MTNNKHGEVAKYYSYNMHQMVPDMLIGNLKFLESLSEKELEIFQEAARISTEVEMEEGTHRHRKQKSMPKVRWV